MRTQGVLRAIAVSGSLLAACGVARSQAETRQAVVLHTFANSVHGALPAQLIRDHAGNLYGTTSLGGTANRGVVYKIDKAGRQTVLYSFKGGPDGRNPFGLIRDQSGNLYGMTGRGGAFGSGCVFKLDTAGNETALYSFAVGDSGGGLVLDPAGNLYGTERGYQVSTLFMLDTTGHTTVLHSFPGPEGGIPGGLTRDAAGNLYGTASGAGPRLNQGFAYKLDPTGNYAVLHTFKGGDKAGPILSSVIVDATGDLYGTTSPGFEANGTVYELSSSGHFRVLYRFTGGAGGGGFTSGLIRDAAGNFYGTTASGGTAGMGVVFELDQSGHETVLHSFTGSSDGGDPLSGVIRDEAGNLYGTTFAGGTPANIGTIFRISPAGNETVLYRFAASPGGTGPQGVSLDAAGNLYGTTVGGGTYDQGLVYKLAPNGQETVLYSFTGGADGGFPSGITVDAAGNLFGTTIYGGTSPGVGGGVVFKLDPDGHETVLHTFAGGADGFGPESGVILDSAGNLYGTAIEGGPANAGVVFGIDTAGQETILYGFTGGADGAQPFGGLARDSEGNFYGTTSGGGASGQGVVFKLDTAGQFTVLHAFTGGNDGGQPFGSLAIDPAGNLYGTASQGGANSRGVVFKLDTTGREKVLYDFPQQKDGGIPWSGVVLDSAGNIYGTTLYGGTQKRGVVFEIDAAGRFNVLNEFASARWTSPSGIALDPAGDLFGTAAGGGKLNGGVVFEIRAPAAR